MKSNGSVEPQARLHPGAGRRKAVSHPKGRQVEPAALAEIQALLGDRPRRRDLLIEHLHLIQDHYRQLAARHLAALAHEMRLALAEVYEVATFYAHFDVVLDDSPPPALTVRVCDSLTCAMLGGERLREALDEKLGRDVRVSLGPARVFKVVGSIGGLFVPALRDMMSTGRYFETGKYVADTRVQAELFGPVPTIEDTAHRMLADLDLAPQAT